ncbi:hypothetical protein L3Y34_016427 [Caenorhabditis briggsae]|uniref:Uncharacterized protein n=1 Tax=Caenorhabditis briggsae TaxID=6238 RepID=A0AAE9DZ38_CAEBR|nr:hypothetical protein L3Y34_016427 [Caenorhabditis briggsae]
MRGVPTLLLLIGLSSVRPEKSIIDRLIANQATNSEQKIVLESVATILSWSPTQYFKYELVKIVEKNLRNPTNIGGNVSEKAIDNIREVFKNSKNPLTVVEFLEICMDFLKTSNNNEVLKFEFIDRSVEKFEGNASFEDIKTLIETGQWILPTETSNYLGIQILQTPPPIIDRMIENEADLMEKRLILFELKTIMNFAVKSSSYKHTLYTLIRKNKKYEDPDYVGGPISMQAIRNIQNALKMSENPKAFLEFLDICMDFLKSPATTNSPKWMVLHEAVTIIDKGYSIEEVKKSLMDVPSNVLESIFEALGIPVLLDTTPDDSTVTPTTVATDSPDLSGATPDDITTNLTTTESSTISHMETTTLSVPATWDQLKGKIKNYVKEHPILLSDEFLKIFKMPLDELTDCLRLLYFFQNARLHHDSIENGFDIMEEIPEYAIKPDEDFWRMWTEELDTKLLWDFFKFSKDYNGPETVDFYKEIWPKANLGIGELNDVISHFEVLYFYYERVSYFYYPYTKPMIEALLKLMNLYWRMERYVREKMPKLMKFNPEECNDTLYNDISPMIAFEIQKTMRKFDEAFGYHSCYNSIFLALPDEQETPDDSTTKLPSTKS